jgi:hypothetical protein
MVSANRGGEESGRRSLTPAKINRASVRKGVEAVKLLEKADFFACK